MNKMYLIVSGTISQIIPSPDGPDIQMELCSSRAPTSRLPPGELDTTCIGVIAILQVKFKFEIQHSLRQN